MNTDDLVEVIDSISKQKMEIESIKNNDEYQALLRELENINNNINTYSQNEKSVYIYRRSQIKLELSKKDKEIEIKKQAIENKIKNIKKDIVQEIEMLTNRIKQINENQENIEMNIKQQIETKRKEEEKDFSLQDIDIIKKCDDNLKKFRKSTEILNEELMAVIKKRRTNNKYLEYLTYENIEKLKARIKEMNIDVSKEVKGKDEKANTAETEVSEIEKKANIVETEIPKVEEKANIAEPEISEIEENADMVETDDMSEIESASETAEIEIPKVDEKLDIVEKEEQKVEGQQEVTSVKDRNLTGEYKAFNPKTGKFEPVPDKREEINERLKNYKENMSVVSLKDNDTWFDKIKNKIKRLFSRKKKNNQKNSEFDEEKIIEQEIEKIVDWDAPEEVVCEKINEILERKDETEISKYVLSGELRKNIPVYPDTKTGQAELLSKKLNDIFLMNNMLTHYIELNSISLNECVSNLIKIRSENQEIYDEFMPESLKQQVQGKIDEATQNAITQNSVQQEISKKENKKNEQVR